MNGVLKVTMTIMVLLVCSVQVYANPTEDLIKASYSGDLKSVKKALKRGANINGKTKIFNLKKLIFPGDTALIKAVRRKHVNIVKFLLESKANPNIKYNPKGEGGSAIIILAHLMDCTPNEFKILKLLIQYKADVNTKDHWGNTPLIKMSRSSSSNLKCIKLLLETRGVKVNEKNKGGETAIGNSKAFNNLKVTNLLLKYGAKNVKNITDKKEEFEKKYISYLDTLKIYDRELINSVRFGNFQQMVMSINDGANLNVRAYTGSTPIMIASYNGATEMVKYLIREKANLNAINNSGMTALMLASMNGHANIVKLLIAYDANINIRGKTMGLSAYDMAKINNHTEVMFILKSSGAN